MRLAYVCSDPGVPVYGGKGGSLHVQSVIRELCARGVEVHLFARRVGGPVPAGLESVELRRLARPPSGQTAERERFLLEDNESIRSQLEAAPDVDIIYERHALWSFAAMEHAARVGRPGLLEINAPLVEEQRRYRQLHDAAGAADAVDRAFRAASSLLPVSEPLAGWVRECAGGSEKIRVVSNGVDVDRFAADVEPLAADPARTTIGFLGSLRPWHGVEQLVEVFLRLHRRGLPVRLLIVGDGPMGDSIRSMCAALPKGCVELVGAVGPLEVPGFLASMDIAVAPYPRHESFYFSPLKLFEYMAAGLPIVASRHGQVAEVIEHGRSGILYEPDDLAALEAACAKLVGDGELRQSLGDEARRRASAEHRWSGVVDRLLEAADMTTGVGR